jgi:hypothetical protein
MSNPNINPTLNRLARLTALHHRHLGLGPQPPLPLPHQNRRPIPDPLPLALVTPPPGTPPLLLPHSHLAHHPTRALSLTLLDPHKWKPQRRRRLGNPAESVPPRPRRRLHRASTICEPQWPVQDTGYLETHKHWWDCRGARWKVWGHSDG